MHPVWTISELAAEILFYLSIKDLKRVLRLSRRDFSLVLPLLWKKASTNKLRHLMDYIPHKKTKGQRYVRFQAYMSHIECLSLPERFDSYEDEQFGQRLSRLMVKASQTMTVFPRIRTLQIDLTSAARLSIASMAVTPTLERLLVGKTECDDAFDDTVPWQKALVAFRKALEQAANLIEFRDPSDLDSGVLSPDHDNILLDKVLLGSQKLSIIRLNSFRYTKSTISSLIVSPRLKVLDIGWPEGYSPLNPKDFEHLPAFPYLTSFTCSDCYDDLLLLTLLSKMKTLRTVKLELRDADDFDIPKLCSYIAQSRNTIRTIEIEAEIPRPRLSDFSPLHTCTKLTSVALDLHGVVVDATNNRFKQMAQSWPELRSIAVTMWEHFAKTPSGIHSDDLKWVTMDVVQYFAKHCCNITNIEVNCIRSLPDCYPELPSNASKSDKPIHLDVFGAFAEITAIPHQVAVYLRHVLGDREITLECESAYAECVQLLLDEDDEESFEEGSASE